MSNIFVPQKVLHLSKELEKKKPNLYGMYIISPKIDGWYIYFPYSSKTKTWHTPRKSSMQVCKSFEWLAIEKYLDKLPKPTEDCILIAEAYIPDMGFSEMNGLFNRTVGDFSCKDVKFALHDIVFVNSFRAYPMTAKERWKYLVDFDISDCFKYFEKLYPLASTIVDNFDNYFYKALELNYEGIVCKREDSLFSFGKRNSDLLKLKLNCTVDCLAVSLEEGTGKKGEDSLTLISERQNGVQIRTVIGKQIDKVRFINNPESILGKIVEIKAMEEFENGQLRQPVFSHIREDKNINDID